MASPAYGEPSMTILNNYSSLFPPGLHPRPGGVPLRRRLERLPPLHRAPLVRLQRGPDLLRRPRIKTVLAAALALVAPALRTTLGSVWSGEFLSAIQICFKKKFTLKGFLQKCFLKLETFFGQSLFFKLFLDIFQFRIIFLQPHPFHQLFLNFHFVFHLFFPGEGRWRGAPGASRRAHRRCRQVIYK